MSEVYYNTGIKYIIVTQTVVWVLFQHYSVLEEAIGSMPAAEEVGNQ